MILVYTTCKNKKEAEKISSHLLKRWLCGCTNYFPITSRYRSKDKLVQSHEYGLLIKTENTLYENARKEIKKIHSYTVPCIIKLNVADVDSKYRAWLRGALRKV